MPGVYVNPLNGIAFPRVFWTECGGIRVKRQSVHQDYPELGSSGTAPYCTGSREECEGTADVFIQERRLTR